MSCSAKPSSFYVAATSRRAGNCLAAHVVIAACIMSSVIILPFSFGHRNSTSYPVRPTRPPRSAPGRWSGLAGSQYRDGLKRRLTSDFYRQAVGGFSMPRFLSNIPAIRGKPDRFTMPANAEPVISQRLPLPGWPIST